LVVQKRDVHVLSALDTALKLLEYVSAPLLCNVRWATDSINRHAKLQMNSASTSVEDEL
jgi:hypothetical protein